VIFPKRFMVNEFYLISDDLPASPISFDEEIVTEE